jgi:uncharacterized protein (TIGR02598 family)
MKSYAPTEKMPPAKNPRHGCPGRRQGFTLAEVMISLGIVATVMVGMLAIIPHATKSIRESNNMTVMGRIAQEVISDIQMSDWENIDRDYKGKRFLYDNEGLLYEGRTGQLSTYEARIDLKVEPVKLSGDFEFRPDNVRRIEVDVEFTPGGIPAKKEEDRKRYTKRYNFYVANQSRLTTPTPK